MIGIDTNVLLRYLTQDDARQSPLATRFVERLSDQYPGHVSLVTLAEMVWVLESRFRATSAEVAETVTELLSDPRFSVQEDHAVWLALEAVERSNVDLPDALIAYLNSEQGCSHTVTFDQRATRVAGMVLLQ